MSILPYIYNTINFIGWSFFAAPKFGDVIGIVYFCEMNCVKRLKKKKIMSTVAIKNVSMSPLEALWTLFKSQPKSVRMAFAQKLIQEEVDAKVMRNKMIVKQSLTQAFEELAEAEKSGMELPNARNLFK